MTAMSSNVIICGVVGLGVDELVVDGGIVGFLVVDGVGFLVVGLGFLVEGLLVVLGFLVVAGFGFFVVLGRLVVVVEGFAVVVAWVVLLDAEAVDVAAPSLFVPSTEMEVTFAAAEVSVSDEAFVTPVVACVVLLGGADEAVASEEASIVTVVASIVVELLGAADTVVARLLLASMVEVVAFATVGVVDSGVASSSLTRFLSMISVTGAFVKNIISVVVSETGNEVVLVVVVVVVVVVEVVVLGCFFVVAVGGFFVVAFVFGVGLRVVAGGFLVVGLAGEGFLVVAAVTGFLVVVLAAVDDAVEPEVLEGVSDEVDGVVLEGASVEGKADGEGLDGAAVVSEAVEGLLLAGTSVEVVRVTLEGASVMVLEVFAVLEGTSEVEVEASAACSVDSRPSGDISVVEGERTISPPVNPARALPMAGDAMVVLSRLSGPSMANGFCAPRERVVPSEV